jgi:putative acetyltransferase
MPQAAPVSQFASGLLRPIRKDDNAAMAGIIRTVMTEFACTAEGFAIHDPEVDRMFETYRLPRSAYFVIDDCNSVAGGAGIASLKGGDADTCELQKFYILKEYRGQGYGRQLLNACLRAASEQGFKRCYIETMAHMDQASALYLDNGFRKIDGKLGNTGHFSCNRWYAKDL